MKEDIPPVIRMMVLSEAITLLWWLLMSDLIFLLAFVICSMYLILSFQISILIFEVLELPLYTYEVRLIRALQS